MLFMSLSKLVLAVILIIFMLPASAIIVSAQSPETVAEFAIWFGLLEMKIYLVQLMNSDCGFTIRLKTAVLLNFSLINFQRA